MGPDARLLTRLLPRGAPLTAALWARVQPGVAWPEAELHGEAEEEDEGEGDEEGTWGRTTRWVVDALVPPRRRRGRWELVVARAALRCEDDDMVDDDFAVA